ncbi:putative endonuclease-reverse transcriptase [Trichonephila clavipes]|nr:putative endonuclease-reverse transcriptase [Trichonephila clavipes]
MNWRLNRKTLDELESIDEKWNLLKLVIMEAGNSAIGKVKKKKCDDWFDQEYRDAKIRQKGTWHKENILEYRGVATTISMIQGPQHEYQIWKWDLESDAKSGNETWALTLYDGEALGIFERKILCCILRGIQVNGSWKRSNLELYKIYKTPGTVKFVKLQKLKKAGHLARMNEERCCKKIFLAKPMGNRPWGRLPLRWIDCIEIDLNILKVKNWKTVAKSRYQEKISGEGQG